MEVALLFVNLKHTSGNLKWKGKNKQTNCLNGQLQKSTKISKAKEPPGREEAWLSIYYVAGNVLIERSIFEMDASLKCMPGQSRLARHLLYKKEKTQLSGLTLQCWKMSKLLNI